MTAIDWTKDVASGYVSIGTHNLYLQASGPPSKPGKPSVIVEAGMADSSTSWAAVSRLTSPVVRTYRYDRSGLGKSELSRLPRTAENMAIELTKLLEAAKIDGPYILVMHSYGGIIGREFLARNPAQVAAMVFVEANTENSYKVRPEDITILLSILTRGLDQDKTIGLDVRHKMLPEEWAVKNSIPDKGTKDKHFQTSMHEYGEYETSADLLAKKQQLQRRVLGSKPVSVIKGEELKDVALILDQAVKQGNGTEENRATVRKWIGMDREETKLQEQHLMLSSNSRFVNAKKSGHEVHLTEPELVVEEIRWILAELKVDDFSTS